ncbi:MAG: RpiB/LacA/LacB family sugar-phosphate isomerase, partial [Candidatus Limnocylindrales bacterium]
MTKIAIGADHLGFPLKETVKAHLEANGHEVVDYGVFDTLPADYPDIAAVVARDVAAGVVPQAVP